MASQAPKTLAACNATDFQTVLRPTPAAPSAAADAAPQAVWLNRQLLQWPGAPASGRFKLYHSANGSLRAPVGGAVTGADGALALSAHRQPVPDAAALRFRYVQPGAVLALPRTPPQRLHDLQRAQVLLVQEDAAGHVQRATPLQTAGALDDLFAAATRISDLGSRVSPTATQLKLWAPTAQAVHACLFDTPC